MEEKKTYLEKVKDAYKENGMLYKFYVWIKKNQKKRGIDDK